jgi:hypothetical protein
MKLNAANRRRSLKRRRKLMPNPRRIVRESGQHTEVEASDSATPTQSIRIEIATSPHLRQNEPAGVSGD